MRQTFAPVIKGVRAFTDIVGSPRNRRVLMKGGDKGGERIFLTAWPGGGSGTYLVMVNGRKDARRLVGELGNRSITAELEPLPGTRKTSATVRAGRITVDAEPWEVFVWRLKNG